MGLRLRVRSNWTSVGLRADATPTRDPTTSVGGSQPDNSARKTDEAGNAVYEFDAPRVVIGRRGGADVQLPHPAVSSTHCTIRRDGSRYLLVDDGSTNGTLVNGTKVISGRAKPLRADDCIEVGPFRLIVEFELVAQETSAVQTGLLAQQLLRDILFAQENEDSEPSMLIINGTRAGERVRLPPPPCSLVVGRGADCDIPLDDADASREHAEVVRDGLAVRARDLGSKNGTLLNGEVLVDERMLSDRDELTVGATVLCFEDPAAATLHQMRDAEDVPVTDLPEKWRPPAPPPGALSPETTGNFNATGEPDRAPPADPSTGTRAGSSNSEITDVPASEQSGEGRLVPGETATPRAAVARPNPRATRGARTDALIYVLAGTVLALSLAGLLWLLQAG